MIKPMLAYKVDAKPIDWTNKVYMQPKLDGIRCVIQLNEKGEVYAYSRTGKPWLNIEHILQDLKPFFDQQEDVILEFFFIICLNALNQMIKCVIFITFFCCIVSYIIYHSF